MTKYASTSDEGKYARTAVSSTLGRSVPPVDSSLSLAGSVAGVPISNTRVLAAAFLAALATGAPTYAFGLYGATLKLTLRLSQSELDTVAASNFVAGLISWIPGMVVDRLGPRSSMTIGGTCMSSLFLCYWFLARFVLKPGSSWTVPVLSAVGVAIFLCNSLVVGSLFKSLVLTCRQGKGAAVGAAKAFVGIGAGVYTCLFDAVHHESDLDFLLLASLFALTCIALPGFCLLPPKRSYKHVVDVSTPVHFRIIYGGLAFLAVTVVGSSALFMFRPLPARMSHLYLPADEPPKLRIHRAMLLLAGWFGPIAALFLLDPSRSTVAGTGENQPLVATDEPIGAPEKGIDNCFDDDVNENNTDDDDDDENDSDEDTVYDPPRISERAISILTDDLSLTQMLVQPSAHLFLITCTVVVGSGTMLTNNMSQMVESLGFPHRATPACLSIFSVSQASARALTGYFSDHMWIRYLLPRTFFVTVSAALGMLGHLVLAIGDDRPMFVAGVIMVGFSFGMMWPLMVLIVGDLYGKRHHGANYLFYDGFASAAGTLLLAKYVTQSVYEAHIQGGDDSGGGGGRQITCRGKSCFAESHAVASGLCFVALLAAVATLVTTRRHYNPAPY